MDSILDELEYAYFGDRRVDKRAKKVLEYLYKGVGTGLTASLGGGAEVQAAYRFFDNDLVNINQILEPHYKKTIERIRQHKIVSLVQDTSEVDMKHMSCVENLGVLNDTKRPGCSLHPVVAFTPDKLCLGILDSKFLIRDAEDLGKKKDRNLRKFEDKESYRWLQGYYVACNVASQCPDTLCVSIGDRESDIFELLLEANKEENKAELIARAWHNRVVDVPRSEENIKLIEENNRLREENKRLSKENKKAAVADLERNKLIIDSNKKNIEDNKRAVEENESIVNTFKYQLNKGKIIGTVEFEMPEGRGRKSRLVKQNVKATKVTLMPSVHKKNLPKFEINAILLEEIDAPLGEDPVIWMLLTTLPIDTLEQIELVIKLYLSRWGIEMFFKVLKSGCKIEELRFKEADRLLACVSMYMIVAWRVLYATFIGRECPDLPCSLLFDVDEWHSVFAVVMKAKPPTTPLSLGEFMKLVAGIGGHRGRKSDGPPGITVIWKGLQAMHQLAIGWRASREFGLKKSE